MSIPLRVNGIVCAFNYLPLPRCTDYHNRSRHDFPGEYSSSNHGCEWECTVRFDITTSLIDNAPLPCPSHSLDMLDYLPSSTHTCTSPIDVSILLDLWHDAKSIHHTSYIIYMPIVPCNPRRCCCVRICTFWITTKLVRIIQLQKIPYDKTYTW